MVFRPLILADGSTHLGANVADSVLVGMAVTAAAAASLVWIRGRLTHRVIEAIFSVAFAAAVLAGSQAPAHALTQPPPSPYWNVCCGFVTISGVQTYVSPHGGCLFLKATQDTPANGGLSGDGGVPTMGTYGSINWNSQPNGSGTPCANTLFKETGGDFYVVQWLDVWDSATDAWITCNTGPPVYNPGPLSHSLSTSYSWSSPPGNCWDPGNANATEVFYTEQASIADIYYDGYGVWEYSNGYLTVNPVQ
jgi:hypothetical protein